MSTINSPKGRLIAELKKEFPRMKKLEEISDVLLAGHELNAVDEAHKKKKWAFLRKGAQDSVFYSAYKNYQLLDKKEKERKVYFEYKRPMASRPKNDSEILKALQRERRGLYTHLTISAAVRKVVVETLSLPNTNLNLIKRTLEAGDMHEQLRTYGKVVNALITKNLYSKYYDYYLIGFRNIPHNYWLSNLALDLLARAI